MDRSLVLAGLDIGTSGVKAVLLDERGRLLASALKEIPLSMPAPDWAEQDPEDWLRAAVECMRAVVDSAGIRPDQIAGLGLTGQMHSLVCVGTDGRPARPAIIWADRRSGEQVRKLEQSIGRGRLLQLAGNPLATGFMIASWEWLRQHEPETARRTRLLMLPKDYVRLRFTGQTGTEPSDAASTLLFDVSGRRWSNPLREAVGLAEEQLPPVHESAAVAGGLTDEIAALTGWPSGIPVVYGASDQAAQAVYQGVIEPGMVSCTVGTGGQIFAPLAEPRPDPQLRLHLFCHALPDRWHLEAAMLTAGMSLRWLRDTLGGEVGYKALADAAAQVTAAQEGLFFLPYLSGERTPHMNPRARGAFIGLTLSHNRAHLARAVMEGVVFALRQGLELVEGVPGRCDQVLVSGGAAAHPLWLRLMADIFQRPLVVPESGETTASGAALLAGVGAGLYADLPAALAARGSLPGRAVLHDPAAAGKYEVGYRYFQALYPALKPVLW